MKYIILLFLLSGCYTQKKATEQTQKALIKYPGVVADIARTAFPCVTTASDTVITTQDSIVYIECPDNGNGTAEDYLKDSLEWEAIKSRINKSQLAMGDNKPAPPLNIIGQPRKVIRVPVTLPVRTITVTTKVEDSAKIFLITAELNKAKTDNEKLQGKVERRGKLLLWLVIALAVSLFLNYIQFKKNPK